MQIFHYIYYICAKINQSESLQNCMDPKEIFFFFNLIRQKYERETRNLYIYSEPFYFLSRKNVEQVQTI